MRRKKLGTLLYASSLVTTSSLESQNTKEHLTIDLNALKNAAEVVKLLKALNEDGVRPESPHREEVYGKQEEGLQGIDLDYLGVDEARNIDIRDILQLIQKNRDAQENFDLTKPELSSRVYYISNPQVLEKYRKRVKKENERDSSASSDPPDVNEKRTKDIWELINSMRREGAEDRSSRRFLHPRLLHLNLEKKVPNFGAGEGEKEVKKDPNPQHPKVIKDDNINKYPKLTSAVANLGTTKMATISQELHEKFKEKEALRTTKYELFEQDYTKRNAKTDSWESSTDDDTRSAITRIDFKAKDASKEEFDDKSLESYKPRRKESKFDDDSDDYTTKKEETSITTLRRKETTTTIDDNYSASNSKKKRDRWGKEEKINKWEKREKSGDRVKYKPRREPRKEERFYERPKIKPHISRPINKVSKLRNNNNYRSYGRTPIPIVGKRVVYEED